MIAMSKFNGLKIFKEFRQLSLLILVGALLFFLFKVELFKPIFGFAQNLTLPVQTGFYRSTQGLRNTLETFTNIGSLRSTNAKLKEENVLLLAQNAVLKKLEGENKSLREQLRTPKKDLSIKATAAPIGFSGLGSESILLIDRGKDSNIKKGDFVVVKDILIGKVVAVNSKISSVQLLADPSTKIPVRTDTGSEGILEGQFGSSLVLTNVSQDQVLKEGQILLTSGRNEYPKDLVVGRIKKVNRIEKEFFQKAEIEPLLANKDLSLVYILSSD